MKKGRFSGRADYRDPEAARSRPKGARTGQGDRSERRNDLHLEVAVSAGWKSAMRRS